MRESSFVKNVVASFMAKKVECLGKGLGHLSHCFRLLRIPYGHHERREGSSDVVDGIAPNALCPKASGETVELFHFRVVPNHQDECLAVGIYGSPAKGVVHITFFE